LAATIQVDRELKIEPPQLIPFYPFLSYSKLD